MTELREIIFGVVLETSRLLVLGNFNIYTEAALTGTAEELIASVAFMEFTQFILELPQERVCTLFCFYLKDKGSMYKILAMDKPPLTEVSVVPISVPP